MLRQHLRIRLEKLLEDSYFGFSNFRVQYGTSDYPDELLITFLPVPAYEFSVNAGGPIGMFFLKETPGPSLLKAEIFPTKNFEEVLDRVSNWLKRLREDYLPMTPFAKQLEELRQTLDAHIATAAINADEFFTLSEAQILGQKLDGLAAELSELRSSHQELQGAVESLLKTVGELQEAKELVNRGTWYRMACGRLVTGLRKIGSTKEVREFALEAAKKLLLGGPE